MNCFIYKLEFQTQLHCGDGANARSLDGASLSICADTLFSALCCTADAEEGKAGVEKFIGLTSQCGARFSDLLPYHGEELYIPRPAMLPLKQDAAPFGEIRKKIKKIGYIPLSHLQSYTDFMNGDGPFENDAPFSDFADFEASAKVSVNGLEESAPYSVAGCRFNRGCGLYGILACDDEGCINHCRRLLKLLGYGGIGGRVSSGYGKFKVIDSLSILSAEDAEDLQMEPLWNSLNGERSAYVSVTTSLPADEELEEAMKGALYTLSRRGGFAVSEALGTPVKKETQYFFSAGSLFHRRYGGCIFNVLKGGAHPVYRYSKPIFLGVDYKWSL